MVIFVERKCALYKGKYGMYLHVSTIVCHTFQIKGDEIKESFTPSKIKGKLRVSVQA